MPSQDDKVGALWVRQTRDGAEYYKGTIELEGRRHQIVVFRNGYKTTDRQPHLIVYKESDLPVARTREDEA